MNKARFGRGAVVGLLVGVMFVPVSGWTQAPVPNVSGSQTGAKAQDVVAITLGPLQGTLRLDPGWARVGNDTVASILQREGVKEHAEFVVQGPHGALIFATLKDLGDFSFSVGSIVANIDDTLTRSWGIRPDRIENREYTTAAGVPIAYLRADGMGSGRDFVTSRQVSTFAIWIDAPYLEQTTNGIVSYLVSLYYRSPSAFAAPGYEIFSAFVDSLRPVRPNSQATEAAFKQQVAARTPAVGQTRAGANSVPGDAGVAGPSLSSQPAALSATLAALNPEEISSRVALMRGMPRSAKEYEEGVASLKRLMDMFPANGWLVERYDEWIKTAREAAQTADFLKDDRDGRKAAMLADFHRKAYADYRLTASTEKQSEYLEYLDTVWPGNPITSPPDRPTDVREWTHPVLGLKFIYQMDADRPGGYWRTERPVVASLNEAGATAGSDFTWVAYSFDSVKAFCSAHNLAPATVSQYSAFAGTQSATVLQESVSWWAADRPGTPIRLKRDSRGGFEVVQPAKGSAPDFFAIYWPGERGR